MKGKLNKAVGYLAHSGGPEWDPDLLRFHLRAVAERAAQFASVFGASEEARLAGVLHDLGKYGDLFQRRLKGEERGIDHWCAGAWVALKEYRDAGIASALAIQGHHIGLQQADKSSLSNLSPEKMSRPHPMALRLSDTDMQELLRRFQEDELSLPNSDDISASLYKGLGAPAAGAMLDVRMLFSVLVDADFIETHAHFRRDSDSNRRYPDPALPLDPERGLNALTRYVASLRKGSKAAPEVNRVRTDLLDACLKAACLEPGLFTLTAPTGAGKTLSMLAFALKHALRYDLRRIVTVIPYLTIIEQTVREYRKVFKENLGVDLERYVLEHHSLAGIRLKHKGSGHEPPEPEETRPCQERFLAENWDAPIIVTTSVQLLESLFSNRPSASRKLHRLARSVVLFDEVQTLPCHLLIPSLAALSHLANGYGSTVVFATATQPAFTHLNEAVRKYSAFGWQPREIVPDAANLFARSRRVVVQWPDFVSKTRWHELAERLHAFEQVLCVVNLKRHAALLFDELTKRTTDGLFHLSTNMCPAHRQCVLKKVKARLEKGEPCRLVSTQCVEAGVDLDFPVVFRAWGPLDSIAQAAGRCNRNGQRQAGPVHLFMPEDDSYPDASYRQAAAVAQIAVAKRGSVQMDIQDPVLFQGYYQELYDFAQPENQNKELLDAVTRQDFVKVADLYRVIQKEGINVLVPYCPKVFEELKDEAFKGGLSAKWIVKARPYTVGLFRPTEEDPLSNWLNPIPLGKGVFSEDWFVYLNEKHYHRDKGLVPSAEMDCLIA